jgi:hypothetical protein
MADNKELEAQLTLANKAVEDAKTAALAREAEIKKLKEEKESTMAELNKAKESLKTFEQKKKDDEWTALKQKLPKGMTHGDEEAKTRKMYEETPALFAQAILDFKAKAPAGKQGEVEGSGEDHVERVGRWDPMTQKYVSE